MTTTLAAPACKNCGTEMALNRFNKAPTYCSIRCKRRDQRSASEHETSCATCETTFVTRRPDAKYCSPACRDPHAKRCSEPECKRPRRARGLCNMHWSQQHGTRAKALTPCTVCGAEIEKDATTKRQSVCSYMCRAYLTHGHWPASAIPVRHAARGWIPRPEPTPFHPEQRDCEWCGATFTARRESARFCRRRCKAAHKVMRYRARKHNAQGTYTFAEVMHLYIAFGKVCAYCRKPIVGLPEPEHVIPLSRGGSNSLSNILPSCKACNSDKRDLFLHEWSEDRKRRHLPPRITEWRRGDPLYSHLAIIQQHEHAT